MGILSSIYSVEDNSLGSVELSAREEYQLKKDFEDLTVESERYSEVLSKVNRLFSLYDSNLTVESSEEIIYEALTSVLGEDPRIYGFSLESEDDKENFFMKIWRKIREMFSRVVDFFTKLISGKKKKKEKVEKKIKDKIEEIKSGGGSGGSGGSSSSVANWVKDILDKDYNQGRGVDAKREIKEFNESLDKVIKSLADNVENGVNSLSDDLNDFLQKGENFKGKSLEYILSVLGSFHKFSLASMKDPDKKKELEDTRKTSLEGYKVIKDEAMAKIRDAKTIQDINNSYKPIQEYLDEVNGDVKKTQTNKWFKSIVKEHFLDETEEKLKLDSKKLSKGEMTKAEVIIALNTGIETLNKIFTPLNKSLVWLANETKKIKNAYDKLDKNMTSLLNAAKRSSNDDASETEGKKRVNMLKAILSNEVEIIGGINKFINATINKGREMLDSAIEEAIKLSGLKSEDLSRDYDKGTLSLKD